MEIKLSAAGKMPCPSWSLPAQACITGSKLRGIKGSSCSICYAFNGNYRFKNVKLARMYNLTSIDLTDWTEWINSMVLAILKTKNPHFRWFDSGDLQSIKHLEAIVQIAKAIPHVKFWLPTHEKGFVVKYLSDKHTQFPDNLIVRISAAMIDGKPTEAYPLTSTIHKHGDPIGQECIAYKQGGKCLDCRACWDKSIPNISYPNH